MVNTLVFHQENLGRISADFRDIGGTRKGIRPKLHAPMHRSSHAAQLSNNSVA